MHVQALSRRTQRSQGNTTMKKLCLALALLIGATVVAAGSAEAQRSGASANCRYTSSDVAKGYRC
jgi:hypothetical protein